MPDPSLFRLRVTFCKQGRLALLSHLEVARAIERAVRRAQLPFAVSQGFSPHMKIAFGAALPVGVGGTHEMVDLQLLRYVRPEEALLALQKESVPDLMVKECVYIEPKAPAASAAFPLSTYRALLSAAPANGVGHGFQIAAVIALFGAVMSGARVRRPPAEPEKQVEAV